MQNTHDENGLIGRARRAGLTVFVLAAIWLSGSAHAAEQQAVQALRNAPLSFVSLGDWAEWAVVSAEYRATVSATEVRLRQPGEGNQELTVRFSGARNSAPVEPLDPQRRRTTWFHGRGEQPLLQGAHYGRLRYTEIYPGVDLLYYGRERRLEYDFLVRPGADPGRIRLALDAPAELDVDGGLLAGSFRIEPPEVYQIVSGERRAVEGRFELSDPKTVGFALGDYDRSIGLVIDPRIGLATFLGGEAADRIRDIHVASDGSVWVAGETDSFDFPLQQDAFPSPLGGGLEVFASRLRQSFADPLNPVWELESTIILGGSGNDRAQAVTVDSAGRVYLVGETRSTNFPVTNGARQSQPGGGVDGFVTVLRETDFPFFRLTAEGDKPGQIGFVNFEIEYSTLLGGAQNERIQGAVIGPFAQQSDLPCVGVFGVTSSADFPSTLFAVQPAKSGGSDGFFTVFCRELGRSAPYSLTYSTFFGGAREELDARAAIASDGSFCIGVRTSSPGFRAPGFQSASAGANDFYATCHAPIRRTFGLPFLYRELGGTYFGGVENETLVGMALQELPAPSTPPFRLWALLESPSTDIPVRSGLPAPPAGGSLRNPGTRSLLLVGFSGALDELLTQFWVGGSAPETGGDLAMRGNCLALTGNTRSADFPVSETFNRGPIRGAADTIVAKYCFDGDLNATREYSGFFGSTAEDIATAIAMGPDGNELITGYVDLNPTAGQVFQSAVDFEVTANSPQPRYGGGRTEGFIFELFRPRIERPAIVGAADFRERRVAPGQILSLFGVNIGPAIPRGAELDAAGRLTTQLGPTRVLFNGRPAPLVFAAKNQVSVIAPFFLAELSSVRIEVEVDGALSLPVEAATAPTAPAVFTLSQTGVGQSAALHQDFSVNGPGNPARGGDAIQVYLTGGGQTSPPGVDGEITPLRQPFPTLRAPVRGAQAQLLYAGSAPGLLQGVNQINVIVPRNLPPSDETPLEIVIGGEAIQPGSTIVVR